MHEQYESTRNELKNEYCGECESPRVMSRWGVRNNAQTCARSRQWYYMCCRDMYPPPQGKDREKKNRTKYTYASSSDKCIRVFWLVISDSHRKCQDVSFAYIMCGRNWNAEQKPKIELKRVIKITRKSSAIERRQRRARGRSECRRRVNI